MATGTAFEMHGAREVLTLAGNAVHLEQHVRALERAVDDAPNLAFDLSRALIETICATILKDKGIDPPQGMKSILAATFQQVTMPAGADGNLNALKEYSDVANGLSAAIQGLTNLRHSEGIASHGKDGYKASGTRMQAEFVARSADAIVNFLYRCHRQGDEVSVRHLVYERQQEINDYIDDSNEAVRIFEYEFPPSKVLFDVDREAYREVMLSFSPAEPDQEQETENA
jgi:hypothetical protein